MPLAFVPKIPFKVVKKTVKKMKRKNYFFEQEQERACVNFVHNMETERSGIRMRQIMLKISLPI